MHHRPNLLPTLILLLLSLACYTASVAQQNANTENLTSASSYRIGEKLTYNVSFSTFSTAAHIELLVTEPAELSPRRGIELHAHVETVEVVSAALYAINNDYTTVVDPQSGLPLRAQVVAHRGGTTQEMADITQPIVSGAYDYLSALFYARTLPLAQGTIYPLTLVGDGGQVFPAEIKVVERESVKTTAGSFNAIATQLRAPGNQTLNSYRARLYFSDDERHVPVLLTAKLPSGEIRIELASIEQTNIAPSVIAVATPTPLVRPIPRSRNKTPDPTPANLPGLPFKIGEPLNFTFYLGNSAQPVGTASYQVRARGKYFGREGILLSSITTTSPVGQRLFPVNDQINSYVDANTLLPFRTELNIQESRHRVNDVINFDQERGAAVSSDGKSIEIPVGTYDLVSVIYALRSFDLTPPKHNAVSLLINHQPRTLSITSLKRETIELGGQRIPAIQLSLTTDDPQGDRFTLRLWVSNDRSRLPLRLTATTPLGPVRADLSIIPLNSQ